MTIGWHKNSISDEEKKVVQHFDQQQRVSELGERHSPAEGVLPVARRFRKVQRDALPPRREPRRHGRPGANAGRRRHHGAPIL